MSHIPCLVKHELRNLLYSSTTYIAGAIFTLFLGAFYFDMLNDFSREPQSMFPAEAFYQRFWVPVLFLVPLLTMKSIAEERRQGGLEVLMTTPVSIGEIVLGKFFAIYIVYGLFWMAAFVYPLLALREVDSPVAAGYLLDWPTLLGGYTFVMLSGLLFVAIGVLSSSLTRSQLTAGMLAFTLLFVVTAGASVLDYEYFVLPEKIKGMEGGVDYLRLFAHLEDFSRGVIDSRPFFFYVSNTALALGVATLVTEYRI